MYIVVLHRNLANLLIYFQGLDGADRSEDRVISLSLAVVQDELLFFDQAHQWIGIISLSVALCMLLREDQIKSLEAIYKELGPVGVVVFLMYGSCICAGYIRWVRDRSSGLILCVGLQLLASWAMVFLELTTQESSRGGGGQTDRQKTICTSRGSVTSSHVFFAKTSKPRIDSVQSQRVYK